MESFHLLMALAYFKETKDQYRIGELSELLGTSHTQVEAILSKLIDAGYLAYTEGLLQITKKGFAKLISENQGEMVVRSDAKELVSIAPDRARSFEEPYVPIDFDAKLGLRKKSKRKGGHK